MKYEIELRPRALKDLRALSRENQKRVLDGIAKLGDDLDSDVKRLTNGASEYRLRVGDYRVLFEIEKRKAEGDDETRAVSVVIVYRVRLREDAYR